MTVRVGEPMVTPSRTAAGGDSYRRTSVLCGSKTYPAGGYSHGGKKYSNFPPQQPLQPLPRLVPVGDYLGTGNFKYHGNDVVFER